MLDKAQFQALEGVPLPATNGDSGVDFSLLQLTTWGTQGSACLLMDQTQRPQLGPFCHWSPPDADNWPECPDW